jgi:hypothetical protein
MVALPSEAGITTPERFTEATLLLLVVQAPPEIDADKPAGVPTQKVVGPVIVAGVVGLPTVTVVVAETGPQIPVAV